MHSLLHIPCKQGPRRNTPAALCACPRPVSSRTHVLRVMGLSHCCAPAGAGDWLDGPLQRDSGTPGFLQRCTAVPKRPRGQNSFLYRTMRACTLAGAPFGVGGGRHVLRWNKIDNNPQNILSYSKVLIKCLGRLIWGRGSNVTRSFFVRQLGGAV